MKLEFLNIAELRAKYLTEPVTLAYCNSPEAIYKNNAPEVNDFNPLGKEGMSSVSISCLRGLNETTIEAFHSVDARMKYFTEGVPPLIIVYPLQELMQDPYDEEELRAMVGIAKGWAEDSGAKIVLLLDTSNSWEYYLKPIY